MTMWADPEVVVQRAEGWTRGQLNCRLGRYHSWDSQHTILYRHSGGTMEVEQRCSRNCGVVKRADMDPTTGHLLSRWRLNYSSDAAKRFLLRDADNKPVGRIGEDSMAMLRLIGWANCPVVDVDDE